jgi:carbamoylphosphate synthase large subunit
VAGLAWVAPDIDDVVRVNSKVYSRSLADELGIGQPRGITCERLEDWDRARLVALELLENGPVVVKEAYGVSGKGIVVIDSPGRLDRVSKRIAQAAERNEGRAEFTVEQWVDKDRDFNYQLTVDRNGGITFDSVKQILTRSGVHLGHYIPAELTSAQLDEIHDVADTVGARLHRDGYWGVVGIDALTQTDGTLHPVIEINARCNMSTYQLPAQHALGGTFDVALARHYEIRTTRPIPFARVREVLGDLLLVPGHPCGMVVLNHATLNAAGALCAAGEPWVGRIYGLLCGPDRAHLDDLNDAVTRAFASLSTADIPMRSLV